MATRIMLVMALLLSITLVLLTTKIKELFPLYVMGYVCVVTLILAIIVEIRDSKNLTFVNKQNLD